MLLTKQQLRFTQDMPTALIVELRFATLMGYDHQADNLITTLGENAAKAVSQDYSGQGLGDHSAKNYTYAKVENFVSRTIKVETRVPSSIANMTRSYCLDYLKAQRNMVALQGTIDSQMNAFTYKFFLVQDQFKLIPAY